MIVTAITKSGSVYRFMEKDGKTYFQSNMATGLVSPDDVVIKIGKPIEVYVYKEGLYGDLDDDPTFFRTTEVKDITVRI